MPDPVNPAAFLGEFAFNCGLIALQLWWNFCDWWKRQSADQKAQHLVFAVIIIITVLAIVARPEGHVPMRH